MQQRQAGGGNGSLKPHVLVVRPGGYPDAVRGQHGTGLETPALDTTFAVVGVLVE